MLNLNEAIQEEVETQYQTALQQEAEVQGQRDDADKLLLQETYAAINGQLSRFDAELPPIQRMILGTTAAGKSLYGPEGWAVFMDRTPSGKPMVVFMTDGGRRVEIRSREDVQTAVQRIANEHLRQYRHEVTMQEIERFASMRPVLRSGLSGFYGMLLVEFDNNVLPGATFRGFPAGKEVRVATRDKEFLTELSQPGAVCQTENRGLYFRYDAGQVYLASLATNTGCTFWIDGSDQARLCAALEEYLDWSEKLSLWADEVTCAGLLLDHVEDF